MKARENGKRALFLASSYVIASHVFLAVKPSVVYFFTPALIGRLTDRKHSNIPRLAPKTMRLLFVYPKML